MSFLKNNRETLFLLLAILYISLLIFKPLFSFYFWRDDFFVLFNASHNQSSFWPYYIAHSFYIPLWDMFKLSPAPYFLTNFLLRMIISTLFFLVVKKITHNLYFSFFIAALWSISPIGIENNVLIVTTMSMFFAALFQISFLYSFFQKKLFLSLLFIFFEFLIAPDRGGGLIFFSSFLLLTPYFIKKKFTKLRFFISSIISAFSGVFISRLISSYDRSWENNIVSSEILFKNLLDIKSFFFLFLSSIIPSSLWNTYINSLSIVWIAGALLFLLLLFLMIKIRNNTKFIYVLVGLSWVVSNLLIIYLFQHYLNESEERYYSGASLGASFLIISIFYLLPKNIFLVLSGLAVITFGVITNTYLNAHQAQHGYYAKPFWQAFRNEVPAIENKTLFVIKLEPKTPEILNRYADIVRVGAIVSEASVAVHLGTDYNNIKLSENWDEKQLSNDVNFAQNNNYDIVYFLYNGNDLKKVSDKSLPGSIH